MNTPLRSTAGCSLRKGGLPDRMAKYLRDPYFPVVLLGAAVAVMGIALAAPAGIADADGAIPNLIGTWSGDNNTISDKKGLKTWKKTVHITEQTDRRFRGHFVYSAGRKDFFGVIYPDNVSFTWVASDSKGYNHGRILGADHIAACYVEPGEEATAGCADLTRETK